ncbi:Calcium-dependent protein kinase 1 [Diplonema papillatum]|nr:Calcium-dependent protein kinase 1 [Diplonema papillatum]
MGCVTSGEVHEKYYRTATTVGDIGVIKNDKVVTRRAKGELRSVNNYKIVRPLGRGSYGEVYLCKSKLPPLGISGAGRTRVASKDSFSPLFRRSSTLSRLGTSDSFDESTQFALKVLHRENFSVKEFEILCKVQHPNVVQLIEYIDDVVSNSVFLVFEVLSGGPVAKLLSSGHLKGEPFTEDTCRDLCSQIVLGMIHLHEHGVIHRDIKPENIVFTADRVTVKIIDFGQSRLLKGQFSDDSSRLTKGTPFFQAPEMLTGFFFPDKATDVWALGVLFYALLIGEVPFGVDSSSLIVLWEAIRVETPDYSKLSKPAADLIRSMLQRDLSRRATLPALIQNDWFKEGAQLPKGVDVLENSLRSLRSIVGNPLAKGWEGGGRSYSGQHTAQGFITGQMEAGPALDSMGSKLSQFITQRMAPEGGYDSASDSPRTFVSLQGFSGSVDNTSEASRFGVQKSSLKHPFTTKCSASGLVSILNECVAPVATRFLIVDDTHHERNMLQRMVEKCAMPPSDNSRTIEVHQACSGKGAVQAILEAAQVGEKYDAAFIDLYMPDMNGIQTTTLIREFEIQEGMESLPILLMTTEEERPSNLEELPRGMQVLTKPISCSQLVRILNWFGFNGRDVPFSELSRPKHLADNDYINNSMSRSGIDDGVEFPTASHLRITDGSEERPSFSLTEKNDFDDLSDQQAPGSAMSTPSFGTRARSLSRG